MASVPPFIWWAFNDFHPLMVESAFSLIKSDLYSLHVSSPLTTVSLSFPFIEKVLHLWGHLLLLFSSSFLSFPFVKYPSLLANT